MKKRLHIIMTLLLFVGIFYLSRRGAALQAEYAAVLQEKRATYAAYRTARDEMRCVLTARANVERLLELPPSKKKKKSHDRE